MQDKKTGTNEFRKLIEEIAMLMGDEALRDLSLVPSAKVGHIGLYRDEKTHEPHEYYCKLPEIVFLEQNRVSFRKTDKIKENRLEKRTK